MTINIAIVSTAHIHTKGFLDNLAKGEDGRVPYAVWDSVVERGQRYAEKYKTKFVANLADLLKDPNVHGFVICAENTRHLPLLEQLLPAGKPVFCEKPLVTNGADLKRLKELVAKHSATLFAGYFQPFGAVMRAIADKIKKGELGKITHARFRNAHHAAYGKWFSNPDLAWFAQDELAGGGAFMDMGTHAVHLLRTLFGPVDEVTATINNGCGAYPDTDDYGIALLKFANGICGTVEASWVHQGGPVGLEIQGSAGAIWDLPGKGYVFGKPGSEPQVIAAADARPQQVDRLIAVIKGSIPREELEADLRASEDAVAIMEAAYLSNKSRGWVKVGGNTKSANGK
jgi:predicted dehydrogenase